MRRERAIGWSLLLCMACSAPQGSTLDAGADAAEAPARAELPALCARPGADSVRDVFCQGSAASISSLRELQDALGIDPEQQGYRGQTTGAPIFTSDTLTFNFAIALGHSTALSGHVISPINPRVIFLTRSTVLAFQRGVQRAELAAPARDRAGFNFYLLTFEQACNAADGGCAPGDLYTQGVEHDWRNVQLRDDEQLKNTALDCRQCHARGRERPQLLMRELEKPWTHFFQPLPDPAPPVVEPGVSGVDLTRDYLAARGDEPYASASSFVMKHSPALVLQGLAGKDQPLLFDSETIQRERWPEGVHGTATEPQPSPTWERSFEAFRRGERLALPYLEPRATDPEKQRRLTQAYARYRAGELSPEELPDLADIFPDDPALRARIGLQTEPDVAPSDALIQACGSCHNDVLDQSLSRARFNIDLSRLPREELELASERIELPASSPLVMPPAEARQLEPGARRKLLALLRDPDASAQPDAALQRAAALGMAQP
jgi:hypothetical protein